MVSRARKTRVESLDSSDQVGQVCFARAQTRAVQVVRVPKVVVFGEMAGSVRAPLLLLLLVAAATAAAVSIVSQQQQQAAAPADQQQPPPPKLLGPLSGKLGAEQPPQVSSREIEKQIVDRILGEGYDKRIRPAGSARFSNGSQPGKFGGAPLNRSRHLVGAG